MTALYFVTVNILGHVSLAQWEHKYDSFCSILSETELIIEQMVHATAGSILQDVSYITNK